MRCVIELDFDLVDDLGFACANGVIGSHQIPNANAQTLGPLLELKQISPQLHGAPIGTSWLNVAGFAQILGRTAPIATWYADDFHQGVIAVSTLSADPLAWTRLIHAARSGAALAGFTSDHSAKIMAAVGEIYGNVVDHSRMIETAYVAYHVGFGRFEFVIADKGVGVLESLRSNPEFGHLEDSGTALDLALETGVSRYPDSDHGFGFQPLFVGLANISRIIRFRSGDHGRTIVRKRDGTIDARTAQLPFCAGLFCSVLCDLD